MALTQKSTFLYGFQVTSSNSSIDFKSVSGGTTLLATLTVGVYSLQDLMAEVVRAMIAVDPSNTYSYSIDRTFSSGTQNRVTIITSGSYLSLLFASGPRAITSVATLLGYTATDKTGATSYQSQSSAGTLLQPSFVGYNYLPPTLFQKTIGSVNLSTSGDQETVTYAVHKFFNVQFKHEAQAFAIAYWNPFLIWATAGKTIEFCPDITDPNTVLNCTLEKTGYDSKGLGFQMKEQLPEMPFFYDTGLMTFRIKPVAVVYA